MLPCKGCYMLTSAQLLNVTVLNSAGNLNNLTGPEWESQQLQQPCPCRGGRTADLGEGFDCVSSKGVLLGSSPNEGRWLQLLHGIQQTAATRYLVTLRGRACKLHLLGCEPPCGAALIHQPLQTVNNQKIRSWTQMSHTKKPTW